MILFGEDFAVGQEFVLPAYTVSEDEIVEFARRWDPLAIHTDPAAEPTRRAGGLMASGIHTLAIHQRLVVDVLWSRTAGGAGRRLDVRFCRAVRPGTTLTGTLRIEGVSPRPRRDDVEIVASSELVADGVTTVLRTSIEALLTARARP